MTPLAKILSAQIKSYGPITIAEYMTQCLSHPEYGYYTSRDPIGSGGDFTTSPEVSQMFGEIIGAWVADIWMKLGTPKKLHLIELGPGRGTLMSDILRATCFLPEFHDALSVHLIDINDVLIDQQKEKLNEYSFISWHQNLSDIDFDAPVIFIGNEFLDALPVHQYQKTKEGWAQRMVGWNETQGFHIGLTQAPLDFGSAKEDDIKEVSPIQENILKDVAEVLKTYNGAGLLIDYGSAHSGFGDTLQALKDHAYVDIFETPGGADLTTHIDFEWVGKILKQNGLSVLSCAEQGQFLKSLGIEHRANALMQNQSEAIKKDIQIQLDRLIAMDQMGELFKVIGFASSSDIKMEGFTG